MSKHIWTMLGFFHCAASVVRSNTRLECRFGEHNLRDRDVKQATQWLLMHKQVPQAELIREVNSCLALAGMGEPQESGRRWHYIKKTFSKWGLLNICLSVFGPVLIWQNIKRSINFIFHMKELGWVYISYIVNMLNSPIQVDAQMWQMK